MKESFEFEEKFKSFNYHTRTPRYVKYYSDFLLFNKLPSLSNQKQIF